MPQQRAALTVVPGKGQKITQNLQISMNMLFNLPIVPVPASRLFVSLNIFGMRSS